MLQAIVDRFKKNKKQVKIRVKHLLFIAHNREDLDFLKKDADYALQIWVSKDGYLIPAYPLFIYPEYFPISVYHLDKFDATGLTELAQGYQAKSGVSLLADFDN